MKKIVFALLMVSIFTGCKKEAEPDQTSEFTGKYDNGLLLINGIQLPTPSSATVTHTVTRKSNTELVVETEIKSTNSYTLGNVNKDVIRASSNVVLVKQLEPQWTRFESEGGYTNVSFRNLNGKYQLNITIVQSNGVRIDNTVATRN